MKMLYDYKDADIEITYKSKDGESVVTAVLNVLNIVHEYKTHVRLIHKGKQGTQESDETFYFRSDDVRDIMRVLRKENVMIVVKHGFGS